MNGDQRKCRTKDCPILFVQRSNGQKFCGDCARKRTRLSNRRSHSVQTATMELLDLPDAEVDRRFMQALAEIRRSGVHRVEAGSFDYRDRYREP